MKRQTVSSGARWESLVGYSRAVRVGQWLSVADTTAAEGGGAVGGDDIGEQAREALRRIQLASSKRVRGSRTSYGPECS
jgi:enamine deaminase RidA (YjgF/YER057c/UK114 family)